MPPALSPSLKRLARPFYPSPPQLFLPAFTLFSLVPFPTHLHLLLHFSFFSFFLLHSALLQCSSPSSPLFSFPPSSSVVPLPHSFFARPTRSMSPRKCGTAIQLKLTPHSSHLFIIALCLRQHNLHCYRDSLSQAFTSTAISIIYSTATVTVISKPCRVTVTPSRLSPPCPITTGLIIALGNRFIILWCDGYDVLSVVSDEVS